MRDIVYYYRFRVPGASAAIGHSSDWNDPARQPYLARFADQEGKVYLSRFYAEVSRPGRRIRLSSFDAWHR